MIVTGLVSFGIGAIWYAPPVFGRTWMKLLGMKQEDARAGAGMALGGGLVLALISSTLLALVMGLVGVTTALDGAIIGFLVWISFIATSGAGSAMFERRPGALYTLTQAHFAITYIVMGTILAVWR